MIEDINSGRNKWKAGRNEYWEGATLADVRRRLGTIMDEDYAYIPSTVKSYDPSEYSVLPESFDVRENWPECNVISGHIRDQSACGSCWAFGSTEAFNDRYCISTLEQTGEAFTQLLSVEMTASCCSGSKCGGSEGCDGGTPAAAWKWFTRHGTVSGGDYSDIDKNDTCSPYTLPNCWHHEYDSHYLKCPNGDYNLTSCDIVESNCLNNEYPISLRNDFHYSSNHYTIKRNVNDIMLDIYKYGSVTANFAVFEDFEYYKSGIYHRTSNRILGGHSIKIIGWGIENGTEYWLCVNSWNEYWGDNGLFKFLKGVNECHIEAQISAGYPRIETTKNNYFRYAFGLL